MSFIRRDPNDRWRWRTRLDLNPEMRELAARVHGFNGTGCYEEKVAEALIRRKVAQWQAGPGSLLIPADPFEVRNCNGKVVHLSSFIDPDTADADAICGWPVYSAVPTDNPVFRRCPKCAKRMQRIIDNRTRR